MNSVCGYFGNRRFGFLAVSGLSALLHQLGDHTGPSGLMAGSYSGTRVAVEIFVKQHQVTPVWVRLEFLQIPKYRSAPPLILEKYVRHTTRQFSRHFLEGHHISRPSWEFNFEAVAEIVMKLL